MKFLTFLLTPFWFLQGRRFSPAAGLGLGVFGIDDALLAVALPAVTGVGTALFGANKQAKENAATRDANIAAQKEADRQNWMHYLMQRGLAPSPDVQTGMVPGYEPGAAMNTRLPLWMKVMTPQSSPYVGSAASTANVPFLVKKG